MIAVKICGITRPADADAAVAAGVDALGFVLWPGSPRAVGLDRAAAIVRALPPFVTPVAVMVSPTRDQVARAVHEGGFRVVQIHGPAEVDALADPRWTLVRAAGVSEDGAVTPLVPDGITVLLDARDEVRHGGTGRTIDWSAAAAVAARRRVILAGGLTPGNVAEAIRCVRPYGVDVASGVEAAPGVKRAELIEAFVNAVRSVA